MASSGCELGVGVDVPAPDELDLTCGGKCGNLTGVGGGTSFGSTGGVDVWTKR